MLKSKLELSLYKVKQQIIQKEEQCRIFETQALVEKSYQRYLDTGLHVDYMIYLQYKEELD